MRSSGARKHVLRARPVEWPVPSLVGSGAAPAEARQALRPRQPSTGRHKRLSSGPPDQAARATS